MAEKALPAKKESVNPVQFVTEVRQEMKRVTWPSQRETMISTVMVLVLIVLSALFFTVTDTVIGTVVQAILGIGK
jgi:preprotein translocase subunit SecE